MKTIFLKEMQPPPPLFCTQKVAVFQGSRVGHSIRNEEPGFQGQVREELVTA